MEKAKGLLMKPEIKTWEAACMVGIEDAAYFSQVFKKYTGLSPTEYKMKHIGTASKSFNESNSM